MAAVSPELCCIHLGPERTHTHMLSDLCGLEKAMGGITP